MSTINYPAFLLKSSEFEEQNMKNALDMDYTANDNNGTCNGPIN
jgi:hypothetical protein